MAIYLLKFIFCSGFLLLAYHLLLKNKTTYQFNRAYLLLSLTFSMAVPFITVEQPASVMIPEAPLIGQLKSAASNYAPAEKSAGQIAVIYETNANAPAANNYKLHLAAGIYSLAALVLLVRFIKNVVTINLSARRNKKLPYRDAWLVLIKDKLTPHTFLHYIFINRDEYVNNRIESDVLKHEFTHARQWHSADVLFVELLQVIYWFNPFIFLYRKAIQLNHEFIADAAVINGNCDVSSYQRLLLGKISGLPAPVITTQFNYSVTKTRLIMMNKNTSPSKALLARLSIVPTVAMAFILFCSKTQAQQQPQAQAKKRKSPATAQEHPTGPIPVPPRIIGQDNYPYTETGASADLLTEYAAIVAKYQDKFKIGHKMPDMPQEERDKLETIYKQMSLQQQRKQTVCFFYPAPPPPAFSPTKTLLNNWLNPKVYGVWIDDKKIDNSELAKYKPDDFGNYFSSRLTEKAIHYKDYKYQVGLMTNAYYKNYCDDKIKNRFKSIMYFRVGHAFKG